MNILYAIHRYLEILKTPKEERRKKWLPRSIMLGGKSAPGYVMKTIFNFKYYYFRLTQKESLNL